ncbi:MAG TPA: NAD(P)-dependent alcohol dehydrogenase [Solirubrobacteraceae bacterium]|nr:NAD(P)-dependent alcohol dehydrogenase [Solirubrobacteraceae bacterium]
MTTPALQLPEAGEAFETAEIERRELRSTDVRIEIAYAGICGTDLHYGHNDFGRTPFPLTPGHEIAGTVAEVGSEVTDFRVGDRVGQGCICNSCGECVYCEQGEEQFCARGMVMTYGSKDYDGTITKGGYSASIVVDQRFVLRIPDGISLDDAAPLLCAGITMYSPLRHWKVGAGSKVAIVGMGGLGHMGVKLASAMGAQVAVISHSHSKEADARRFGATDFRATGDEGTLDDLQGTFDLIISTVSKGLDLDQILPLLAVNGTLVSAGLPDGPANFSVFTLMTGRRSYAGTNIGGIKETQEMLDFCAAQDVRPETEIVEAAPEAVASAWGRVGDGSARYRVVIDTAALTS